MARLGYIKDAPDARDWTMGAAPAATQARGGSVRRHVRQILDQGASNSCVAQWLASSLALLAVASGKQWRLVSRLYIYYYARVALGTWARDSNGKLIDGGCRPRDALRALKRLGAPDEKRFQFLLDKLTKKPGFLLRLLGVDLKFEYRRCNTVSEIQTALAQGYPVGIGIDIDQAFFDFDGPGLITRLDGPRKGGHMLTIVADDERLDAAEVLNSWGIGYRDGGYVKISWSVIAAELLTSDAWAIIA